MDPIRGTGYTEYPKRIESSPARTAGNEEKFSLEQNVTGQESEKEDPETKGVVLELSGRSAGERSAHREQPRTQEPEEGMTIGEAMEQARSFLGGVLRALTGIWQSVRNAVRDFWNSDTTAPPSVEDIPEQETMGEEAVQEAAVLLPNGEREPDTWAEPDGERAESVQGSVRMPDPGAENYREQIQEYLKQVDPGSYVKNSDLLTYYDRQGKLVTPSHSDKNRILYGDRSSRKL